MMLPRSLTVLALGAVLGPAFSGCSELAELPSGDRFFCKDGLAVRWEFKKARLGRRLLVLRGTIPAPEGTLFNLVLCRSVEIVEEGQLESALVGAGSGIFEVAQGSFQFDAHVVPGEYKVVIDLEMELQDHEVAQALEGVLPLRHWQFDVATGEAAVLAPAAAELKELESEIDEGVSVVSRLSEAAAAEQRWSESGGELLTELPKFRSKLEKANSYYTATRQELSRRIRPLVLAQNCFFWKADGELGGAWDPVSRTWVKDAEGFPFSFDRIAQSLENARDLARREYALWILKVARSEGGAQAARAAFGASSAAVRALLAGFWEGAPLASIEARVRGTKRPPRPIPEPAAPGDLALSRATGGPIDPMRFEAAKRLLREADLHWDRLGDWEAPGLYRRLLEEYPQVVDILGVHARVANRAGLAPD